MFFCGFLKTFGRLNVISKAVRCGSDTYCSQVTLFTALDMLALIVPAASVAIS